MAGLSLTFDPLASMAVATAASLPRYSALCSRLQSTGGFLPATRLASTESQANMATRAGPLMCGALDTSLCWTQASLVQPSTWLWGHFFFGEQLHSLRQSMEWPWILDRANSCQALPARLPYRLSTLIS